MTSDLSPQAILDAALSLKGRRVLIMGLGRLGGAVSATRYLVEQGAEVTVTDTSTQSELAASVDALSDLDVRFRLGGHEGRDFREADLVVANPAVPLSSPFLNVAREEDVPITTEIGLFLARCPSPVFGVTGSSGKTTTTTLIGAMIQRRWKGASVGGNMGISLLDELEALSEDVPVVLELSSFQLRHLRGMAWSPRLAVVTNFSINHLDIHGSIDDYRSSKQGILEHQTEDDVAVLNRDDEEVAGWRTEARTLWFATGSVSGDDTSVFVEDDHIVADGSTLVATADLRVPGRHNVANACAASAAALAVGVGRDSVADVLRTFEGVEHRLECVGSVKGVTFVNDSVATSPDRTAVALDAIEGDIVLIAGGYDKGIPFDDLGRRIAERVRCLVLVGETANAIENSVPPEASTHVHHASDFDSAVVAAKEEARSGETVLLSPACASYGMFANFEERGRRFRELVDGM